MNTNRKSRPLSVIAAVCFIALSGQVAADEAYWVTLFPDVPSKRTPIANTEQGDKSASTEFTQQSPIKTTHSKLRRSMMETAVCRTSYRLLSN